MSRCEDHRLDLGALVVGGLEESEADAVRTHLEHCRSCREEHAEIAGAPDLLELTRATTPPVPDRVRDRVVAAAARRSARRRWSLVASAAALGASLLGAAVGWQLAATPAPEIAVPLEAAEPFDAAGWVRFVSDGDDLLVRVRAEGLGPLEDDGIYEAWLYADGEVESIGRLGGDPGRVEADLRVTGSLEDFDTFWITAEPDPHDPAHAGPTVLRAAVPDAP